MSSVARSWPLFVSALCLIAAAVTFALGWWQLAGGLAIACLLISLLRAMGAGSHDHFSRGGVTGKLSEQDIAAVRAYRKKNPGVSLLDAVNAVMKDR